MPKIIAGVGPSYPEGHAPGDGEGHVHPGAGEPMTGVEHPADGTMSPLAGNDGDGEPGEQVVQLPEGEFAVPEGPAAPPAPPRTPPRRPPSVTGSGGVTLPKPGASSAE